MAKLTFVKSAQKNIYEKGKRVEYVSQKGKRKGQTLSKIDRTIPADKNDKIFIAKGESYYWWQFKNGPKKISKDRPKPSQLTQSNYLSQLYDIQERMEDIKAESPGDLEGIIEEFKNELEILKDETESSLENMPESLQSSPTGELLQERIDALDNAISELECIDCEYEEPEDEEIKDELKEEQGEDDYDPTESEIEERKQEKLAEWLDEKMTEISSITLE